jgi:outer membrane protein OmpA-like peptidoglycan-associated protein
MSQSQQRDGSAPAEPALGAVSAQRPPVVTEVGFAFDSHELDAAATARLTTLADNLEAHRALEADLVGYTDEAGDPVYNRNLSQLRAESVRHYLLKQGVPETRLRVVSPSDAEFDTLRKLEPPKSRRSVQIILTAQP